MTTKIETLLPEIKKRHTNLLSPVHSHVYVPVQLRLIDAGPSPSALGTAMGRFYEFLDIALYGGRPNDVKFRVVVGKYESGSKLDVIDRVNKSAREVKSSSFSRSCNLMNRQTLANIFQQLNMPDYQFSYHLYRSSLRGLKTSYTGDEDQLFSDLSQQTVFSVTLPFDVVLQLSDPSKSNGHSLVRHYEGKDYPNCTCINSGTLEGLLYDPEDILIKASLNPEDYSFKRYLSPDVRINSNLVQRFPVLMIKRKYSAKWRRDFGDNLKSIVPLMEYLSKNGKEDKGYPDFWDEV